MKSKREELKKKRKKFLKDMLNNLDLKLLLMMISLSKNVLIILKRVERSDKRLMKKRERLKQLSKRKLNNSTNLKFQTSIKPNLPKRRFYDEMNHLFVIRYRYKARHLIFIKAL